MRGAREKINRFKPLCIVPRLRKNLQIPCKGGAVAGYIHYFFNPKPCNDIKNLSLAAFSGRIQNYDIGAHAFLGEYFCALIGIRTNKFRI